MAEQVYRPPAGPWNRGPPRFLVFGPAPDGDPPGRPGLFKPAKTRNRWRFNGRFPGVHRRGPQTRPQSSTDGFPPLPLPPIFIISNCRGASKGPARTNHGPVASAAERIGIPTGRGRITSSKPVMSTLCRIECPGAAGPVADPRNIFPSQKPTRLKGRFAHDWRSKTKFHQSTTPGCRRTPGIHLRRRPCFRSRAAEVRQRHRRNAGDLALYPQASAPERGFFGLDKVFRFAPGPVAAF